MKNLLHKILFFIARLNKKKSLIYLLTVTIIFIISVVLLLVGLIYMVPHQPYPVFAVVFVIIGGILMFLSLATVALTSLSSNYIVDDEKEEDKKD